MLATARSPPGATYRSSVPRLPRGGVVFAGLHDREHLLAGHAGHDASRVEVRHVRDSEVVAADAGNPRGYVEVQPTDGVVPGVGHEIERGLERAPYGVDRKSVV